MINTGPRGLAVNGPDRLPFAAMGTKGAVGPMGPIKISVDLDFVVNVCFADGFLAVGQITGWFIGHVVGLGRFSPVYSYGHGRGQVNQKNLPKIYTVTNKLRT